MDIDGCEYIWHPGWYANVHGYVEQNARQTLNCVPADLQKRRLGTLSRVRALPEFQQ